MSIIFIIQSNIQTNKKHSYSEIFVGRKSAISFINQQQFQGQSNWRHSANLSSFQLFISPGGERLGAATFRVRFSGLPNELSSRELQSLLSRCCPGFTSSWFASPRQPRWFKGFAFARDSHGILDTVYGAAVARIKSKSFADDWISAAANHK